MLHTRFCGSIGARYDGGNAGHALGETGLISAGRKSRFFAEYRTLVLAASAAVRAEFLRGAAILCIEDRRGGMDGRPGKRVSVTTFVYFQLRPKHAASFRTPPSPPCNGSGPCLISLNVCFIRLSFMTVAHSLLVRGVCQAAARALHTQPSSAASALALIRSQPNQYVIASLAGRKYLLAPRDLLTVPRLNDVRVGDVLALSEIHEFGSREFTLRGDPLIPQDAVKVAATVVEHTKGKMEVIVKKKRRKGYVKTIKHKQPYTRLRIGSIDVALPDQV